MYEYDKHLGFQAQVSRAEIEKWLIICHSSLWYAAVHDWYAAAVVSLEDTTSHQH